MVAFLVAFPVCVAMLFSFAPNAVVVAQDQMDLNEKYTLAAGFYARGEWKQAEAAFADLMNAAPNTEQSIAAAFFLPESQMQQGKFDQAYGAFQEFLKYHPSHPYHSRAMFRMGESAYRTNKHEIAIRLLEEFVKNNPDHELNEFALPYLGQLRNLRSEPQLAQMAFESALRVYPQGSLSNRSRLGLAKALQAQSQKPGYRQEALRFYEFLLTQDDQEIVAETRVQMGVFDFDRMDLKTADQRFRKAIRSTDDPAIKAKATYWLARILIEQRDFEKSIEYLLPIADKQFDEALMTSIWYDGAVAAVRADQNSLALKWVARIRKTFPKSNRIQSAIRLEIDLLQKVNRIEEAIQLAELYKVEDKIEAVRHFALESQARESYQNGDYEKSIRACDTLLDGRKPVSKEQTANWQYLKALAQLGNNEYRSAEITLNEIDIAPQSAELQGLLHLALGTCRFGRQAYSAAAESYRQYLGFDGTSEEALRAKTELAICYAKLGQIAKGDLVLSELTKTSGQTSEPIEIAIEILAETAMQQKQPKIAQKWLRYVLDNSQSMSRKSRLQLRLAFGNSDVNGQAIVSTQSFLDLLTQSSGEMGQGMTMDVAAICQAAVAHAHKIETRKSADASKLYEAVLLRANDEGLKNVARVRLARLLQTSGGRDGLLAASSHLEAFLNSNHQDSTEVAIGEVLYQLGWLTHDMGKLEDSTRHFEKLVSDHPKSKYWSDAAYRLLQRNVKQGNADKAKNLISKIVHRSENEADVPNEVLARVRFFQGQIAVAEKDWTGVESAMVALAPLELHAGLKAQATYWLAESLYQRGKLEQAHKAFESIQASQDLNSKHRPGVTLRLAQILGQQNRWEDAESLSRSAMKLFVEFDSRFEYQYLIARSLERKGLLNDAQSMYQEVVDSANGRLTETAAMAQWRIGEALFHQEKYAKAIQAYYRVDSLYSYPRWRSAALLQAGKCQEQLGNPANARKLYQRLISLYPDSSYLAGAKERLGNIERQAAGQRTADRPSTRKPK